MAKLVKDIPLHSSHLIHEQQLSSDITVNWSWYDESQGIVQWTFHNNAHITKSGILLRGILYNNKVYSPYYFGDAFWAVYYANSKGRGASASNPADNFGVDWLLSPSPLPDNGVTGNVAPIAPVLLDGKLWVVAFIFTLAPGQTWSMLEGGFSSQYQPAPVGVVEVEPYSPDAGTPEPVDMCIGYNPQSVTQWDLQTHTTFQGYYPNPNTFLVLPMKTVQSDVPAITVFGDSVTPGKCTSKTCGEYVTLALDSLKQMKIKEGIEYLVKAVECYA